MTYEEFRERAHTAERLYWQRLLDTHDSVSAMARSAGCHRTWVFKRLARYGLLTPYAERQSRRTNIESPAKTFNSMTFDHIFHERH
jgi:hypothetical protein